MTTGTENLRLGNEADRRRRLGWTAEDAAKRAVELMAAVNAQDPARLTLALDRLSRGVEAVRSCMSDLDDIPSDAAVEEYRAALQSAPPVARRNLDGEVIVFGDLRTGPDRRQSGGVEAHWNGLRWIERRIADRRRSPEAA